MLLEFVRTCRVIMFVFMLMTNEQQQQQQALHILTHAARRLGTIRTADV